MQGWGRGCHYPLPCLRAGIQPPPQGVRGTDLPHLPPPPSAGRRSPLRGGERDRLRPILAARAHFPDRGPTPEPRGKVLPEPGPSLPLRWGRRAPHPPMRTWVPGRRGGARLAAAASTSVETRFANGSARGARAADASAQQQLPPLRCPGHGLSSGSFSAEATQVFPVASCTAPALRGCPMLVGACQGHRAQSVAPHLMPCSHHPSAHCNWQAVSFPSGQSSPHPGFSLLASTRDTLQGRMALALWIPM